MRLAAVRLKTGFIYIYISMVSIYQYLYINGIYILMMILMISIYIYKYIHGAGIYANMTGVY